MTLHPSFQFRPDRGEPRSEGQTDPPQHPHRDWKRLALVAGLGILSWVATYVGMLELIEANMGDLPLVHKVIVGFSVAMLMTMIVWLLDRLFAPAPLVTKACYLAGYIFLSVISIGFGFGFYWKVLESRGEASRSAESAITQVQTSLFAAATRLEQLQSTLDQLTTLSSEKSELEKSTGRSCPNSGPGDGPRRKMREEDAQRFKFASDFVKGRIGTVKSDMSGLDADLQKIVKDDRSVIDARTGTRNDFLKGVGRKLEFTVTGFNAFRSDPQLRQIRSDLADRAEKSTVVGSNGATISCPDAQLQMALRGVVRAIDQLPELEKPKIAAVEGSEATIEAFRRLTTTFFGLLSFKLPPSADELRELQKKAVQSVELQAGDGAKARQAMSSEQAAGLAKRDYVPLSVAIFVDLCLLLVSIGRPVNRFVGMQEAIREAERGPVYPILQRFWDIHSDDKRVKIFEVFRDVIFDLNGQYHVAVPLNVPRHAENRTELKREAQNLANICYALEGKGILVKPWGFLPGALAYRQLRRRGSKFVESYAMAPARLRRRMEKPAFKVYRFRKGAWQEMILGAVMGAAHHAEAELRRMALPETSAFVPAAATVAAAAYAPPPHAEAEPLAPVFAQNGLRASVLDELRPGLRPAPDLSWPEPAQVNVPAVPAAEEAISEAANNNTEPHGLARRMDEETAAQELEAPVSRKDEGRERDYVADGPETEAPRRSEASATETDAIAVDAISGWFGRPRRSS